MKTSLREITQTKTGFFMVKVDQFFYHCVIWSKATINFIHNHINATFLFYCVYYNWEKFTTETILLLNSAILDLEFTFNAGDHINIRWHEQSLIRRTSGGNLIRNCFVEKHKHRHQKVYPLQFIIKYNKLVRFIERMGILKKIHIGMQEERWK